MNRIIEEKDVGEAILRSWTVVRYSIQARVCGPQGREYVRVVWRPDEFCRPRTLCSHRACVTTATRTNMAEKLRQDETGSAGKTAGPSKTGGLFSQLWAIVYHDASAAEKGRLFVAMGALVASSITNLSVPYILQKVVDKATTFRPSELDTARPGPFGSMTFHHFLLSVVGFFAAGATASFLRVYSLDMVQTNISRRLRSRLVGNVLQQDMEFFDEHKNVSATTLVHLANDVETVANLVTEKTARLLRGLNSTLGGTCMLLYISPKLTLASLAVIPFVGATAMLFSRKAKRMAKALKAQINEANTKINERISNIKTVRLAGQEQFELASYDQSMGKILRNAGANARANGYFMGGLGFAINLSALGVLCLGGNMVETGELSVGKLTSFAFYSVMVGAGSASLASVYSSMKQSVGMTDSLFRLLSLPTPANVGASTGANDAPRSGTVEFRNVSFSYPSRPDATVLSNVSLTIPEGSAVAVVGPSGSGKSTLAMLLCRLYNLASGSILIGGQDIQSMDATALRRSIGVVDQEPTLFATSIRENIRYGFETATDAQVESAAKEANAHDFIVSLPDGYDTQVGNSGDLLSGGQKQRIAIARAVINNPSILVLDEATSALDPKSEKLVVEALGKVRQRRTVLVIAHRSSSYDWADRKVSMVALGGGGEGFTLSTAE